MAGWNRSHHQNIRQDEPQTQLHLWSFELGFPKDAEARVICMANLTDYMEDIVSRLDIQPHTHDQTECD